MDDHPTRRTLRTLLFLATALPLGAVGATVLLAGWIVTICLAVTPLVVPALVGFRAAVGFVARAEAALAARLLDVTARPPVASSGPAGFWRRGLNVLADGWFWRQQIYLLLRFLLGGAAAIAELSLLAASLGAIAEPIYYRWADTSFGSWHVDTVSRALLFVPVGAVGLVVALALVRPLGALARSIARGLLRGGDADVARSPAAARAARVRLLALHAAVFSALSLLATVIWAATTRAYYWPEWIVLPLGLLLALHGWMVLVEERPDLVRSRRTTRALAVHEGIAAALAAFLVCVWALTGHGYFWPLWPMLGLALVLAAHATVVVFDAVRRGDLAERVAVLETTRAGVVDQQEAELRRIERDLHDGAQARLVALGMSLGLAEQKLATDPDAAQALLVDARRGAREALEELRDLARGIHPPVLADRGLEAAVSALADRTPLRATVRVDVDERPAAPVESAAYFVVAEALANTGKHAHAGHVAIAIRREHDVLVVEVVDDGDGGADRSGGGLSGLARRIEALDGTLEVSSPRGGPTTVRAVMPCGS